MEVVKTRRNVYYTIDSSPFFINYDGYTFYFSSEFNLKRFVSQIKSFVLKEQFYIKSRYDCELEPFIYYNALYKKIEKRGYKVKITNE